MNSKNLETIARKLPPWTTRLGKRIAVHKRAHDQLAACKKGYKKYGDQYLQPILFIAGLPKSGSTWIEKMVASYPGFHEYLLPAVAKYELITGGSHDFELPIDMFKPLKNMLVLTKMHSHGSPNNIKVLHEAGIHYVVLYRDLRDVAVSYHFYVQNTPWHPEYKHHCKATIQEGISIFANRMLPAYIKWVRSWKQNANPKFSIQLRYEEMLVDPIAGMTRVATLFNLDSSPETIGKIVEEHSFNKMSGGRSRGDSSETAFVRKGVVGDWKNHFTPQLREQFGKLIAELLIETADEEDDSWVTEKN
ncbi:MAG: sulfotransferase domain-containing protein [Planctomycetota bacterium]|nr:sulfotransferase domain-containing protein [Planctomycetota bacterium]